MSLSRPLYNFMGFYFEQLFNNPIRTKAVTSCVLATSANYVSQKLAGNEKVNQDSLFSYGLFGLLFGGTLPHFFYTWIEKVIPRELRIRKFLQFLIERLMFTPFFQATSLYFLSRFEGKNHEDSVNNLLKLYWPILQANWTYLSLLIFVNLSFVPPALRVLVANLIGFCWIIFVANKRRKALAPKKKN